MKKIELKELSNSELLKFIELLKKDRLAYYFESKKVAVNDGFFYVMDCDDNAYSFLVDLKGMISDFETARVFNAVADAFCMVFPRTGISKLKIVNTRRFKNKYVLHLSDISNYEAQRVIANTLNIKNLEKYFMLNDFIFLNGKTTADFLEVMSLIDEVDILKMQGSNEASKTKLSIYNTVSKSIAGAMGLHVASNLTGMCSDVRTITTVY